MCQRVTLSRFCSRCRRIHGNKCLREEDLHKCENWLTERRSGNTGILTNLPTSILKDGGHKSFFITFLSLQRDCENLTSYNVVFFFFFFFPFFRMSSDAATRKRTRANVCGRDIRHTRFCFYQLLSKPMLEQMFKADMALSPFPTQSHLRPENTDVYRWNSVALFSEEA